jgi:hypothetical protein
MFLLASFGLAWGQDYTYGFIFIFYPHLHFFFFLSLRSYLTDMSYLLLQTSLILLLHKVTKSVAQNLLLRF